MVSISTAPAITSFANNPIWVDLLTGTLYGNLIDKGILIEYDHNAEGFPTIGEFPIFEFNHADGTETIVFSYGPGIYADTVNALPFQSSETIEEYYYDRLGPYIIGNETLAQYYNGYFSFDTATNILTILLQPKETTTLLDDFGTNMVDYSVTKLLDFTGTFPDNYCLELEVWAVMDDPDYPELLTTLTVPPSINEVEEYHSCFRLDSLLLSAVEINKFGNDLPDLQTIRNIDNHTIKPYFFTFREVYEDNSQSPKSTSDIFHVLLGAESPYDYLNGNTILATTGIIPLTVDPDILENDVTKKNITPKQPVFISLLNNSDVNQWFNVYVRVYYKNGSIQSTSQTYTSFDPYTKDTINVGLDALSFAYPENIIKMDVIIKELPSNNVIIETTFNVVCHASVFRVLIFNNHLGGWDSVLFRGDQELSVKRTEKRAQTVIPKDHFSEKGDQFNYNAAVRQAFELESEYINDYKYLRYLKELLLNTYIAEVVYEDRNVSANDSVVVNPYAYYRPISLEGRSVKFEGERTTGRSITFKYIENWEQKGF